MSKGRIGRDVFVYKECLVQLSGGRRLAANLELAKWGYFRKIAGIKDNAEKCCKIATIENQRVIKKVQFFLKIITKIFGQFRKKQ